MSAKSTHLFRRGSCPMLILWVPLHFVTSKRHFITLSLELWFGTLFSCKKTKKKKHLFKLLLRFIACIMSIMWHVYQCGLPNTTSIQNCSSHQSLGWTSIETPGCATLPHGLRWGSDLIDKVVSELWSKRKMMLKADPIQPLVTCMFAKSLLKKISATDKTLNNCGQCLVRSSLMQRGPGDRRENVNMNYPRWPSMLLKIGGPKTRIHNF